MGHMSLKQTVACVMDLLDFGTEPCDHAPRLQDFVGFGKSWGGSEVYLETPMYFLFVYDLYSYSG